MHTQTILGFIGIGLPMLLIIGTFIFSRKHIASELKNGR